MRTVLKRLFELTLRIFFRRIEVEGLANIPQAAPVIFVLNHPSGLVDPLFILCLAPRPVSFLAKSTLFEMPVISWFVRGFGSIPVYRRRDEGVDPAQNRKTFSAAGALLGRGGTLAIFPEGTSHSDPRLRPFKTGAARIALGAATTRDDSEPLCIVPASLHYTAKAIFRSAALLTFGSPIEVKKVPLAEDGDPPHSPVRELTSQIEKALSELTLQADSREALDLVERAERIFRPGDSGDEGALGEHLRMRQRFLEGYELLRKSAPVRLEIVEWRIARFEAELAEAGVDLASVEVKPAISAKLAGRALGSFVMAALLFPAAFAGTLIHYPVYRLVGFLSARLSRGENDVVATIKLLGALFIFPLTWIFAAAAVDWRWGIRAAIVAGAAAPLTGWAALVFWERSASWGTALRGAGHAVFGTFARKRLLIARRRIRSEIQELGELSEKLVRPVAESEGS